VEQVEQEVETLMRKHCDGYSGADLAALVREAGVSALKRTLGALDEMDEGATGDNCNQRSKVMVYVSDFVKALEKVGPSVSISQRQRYKALMAKLAGLPVRTGKDEDEKKLDNNVSI
jgi:ribosome biogenesis ATPase